MLAKYHYILIFFVVATVHAEVKASLSVTYEVVPQLTYGVEVLERATSLYGVQVSKNPSNDFSSTFLSIRITCTPEKDGIKCKENPTGLKSEGFRINTSGHVVTVECIDVVGCMYGLFDISDQIRHKGNLKSVSSKVVNPYLENRGLKFNAPLDARTPSYDDTGLSAQSNILTMWDMTFWTEYLDTIALYRFNTLMIWQPHPFPSLVKLDEYPDIALDDIDQCKIPPTYKQGLWGEPQGVSNYVLDNLKTIKKISISEKITFWKSVMSYAKQRGVKVYFITWNVIMNAAEGHYGITANQTSEKTIAYLRASVKQLLLTYPDLYGLGTTPGERMHARTDKYAKMKWIWDTYGEGILDAKKVQPDRTVSWMNRVWEGGVDNIITDFADKYPDPLTVSMKYSDAHVYSSVAPPFYGEKLKPELDKYPKVKTWMTLRNDGIFVYRWGDPDFVKQFLLHLPIEKTTGFDLGSDGYIWARECASLHPQSPRQLEVKKQWFQFMLWGKMGYDINTTSTYWTDEMDSKFPVVKQVGLTQVLYKAWQTSSMIFPLVTKFHWQDWDFEWAVEGCMNVKGGYRDIDDFISSTTMDSSGLVDVHDYVSDIINHKKPSGTTPDEVSKTLHEFAETCESAVTTLTSKLSPINNQELNETITDIAAMGFVGRYYADKISAAVQLYLYDMTKNSTAKSQAVNLLESAAKSWEGYAASSTSQYRPQLLARTRTLDWNGLLTNVKNDIQIAKNR